MKKYIIITSALLCMLMAHQSVFAQGCVAIRHYSNFGSTTSGNPVLIQPGEWTLSTSYRWFRSFRHFRGTHEEPERIANDTEVINWQHALDVSVSFALSSRLAASVTVPLVYNERSSLYEHGGEERHKTIAYGLSDMRVSANYWLLDPYANPRGNIIIGLGVRLPTGNDNAKDLFYNEGENGAAVMQPVDQSIQPGDGFGITTELHFNRQITNSIGLFARGFYLITPGEMNDTPTFRGRESEAYMSIADQYALQAGAAFALPFEQWSFSVGGRVEGVPVRDLVGGSEGFRRPGYIWSVDPGLSYHGNNFSISLNVPVAMVRARPQSVSDIRIEQITGEPTNGDAAFADYLIDFDITWFFGRSGNQPETFY